MYPINSLIPSKKLDRFGTMQKVFNDEEIEKILFFEKILNFNSAALRDENNTVNTSIRQSEVAFFHIDENTKWLWEKIAHLVGIANYDLFLYDIEAIDGLQFTRYNGNNIENPDHYTWHIDANVCGYRKYDRKISGVLMLSDSHDYVGGELQIDLNGSFNATKMDLQKGDLLFFDSNRTHRVTPVTSGIRKTLVFWVSGKTQI